MHRHLVDLDRLPSSGQNDRPLRPSGRIAGAWPKPWETEEEANRGAIKTSAPIEAISPSRARSIDHAQFAAGAVIVIERFERGRAPRASSPREIRIDTS